MTQDKFRHNFHFYNHKRIKDAYKYFKHTEKFKDVAKKVSRENYTKILKEYNSFMLDNAIQGSNVTMPYMGRLHFRNRKTPSDKIDYGHYKKTGEKRPYNNEKTNGYICKLFWEKTVKFRYNRIFRLKLYPSARKRVSTSLKQTPELHRRYRLA